MSKAQSIRASPRVGSGTSEASGQPTMTTSSRGRTWRFVLETIHDCLGLEFAMCPEVYSTSTSHGEKQRSHGMMYSLPCGSKFLGLLAFRFMPYWDGEV